MAYIFLSSHQRPILSDCSIISDTKWSSLVKAGLVVSFPLCLEIIFGLTIWDYVSALVTNSHSPNSFSIHQWSLPEAVINEGFLIESFLLHLLIDVFCSERTYPVSSLSSFLSSPPPFLTDLSSVCVFIIYTYSYFPFFHKRYFRNSIYFFW